MTEPYSTINTAIIENAEGRSMLKPESETIDSVLLDRDWVKTAFMTPSDMIGNNNDSVARFFSTASMKFTSAVIGSSLEINPKPQFTRYADIRSKGVLPGRNTVSPTSIAGNFGMGRYYSEAFDDNAQRIYMRFGVPQYNSLVSFLLNAADYGATQLARTGRISKMYQIGKAVGTVALFVTFPVLATGVYLYKGLSALLGTATSKYYTLKPTMHTYWSSVNTLVNTIAVSKGLFPVSFLNPGNGSVNSPGQLFNINADMTDGRGNIKPNTSLYYISKLMPGLIDSNGYIDVFALAARPQVIANRLFEEVYSKPLAATKRLSVSDAQRNNPDDPALSLANISRTAFAQKNMSFFDFVGQKVMAFSAYFVDNGGAAIESDPRTPSSTTAANTNTGTGAGNAVNLTQTSATDGVSNNYNQATGNDNSGVTVQNGPTLAQQGGNNVPQAAGFKEFLHAEFSGGASFAIFQVDYTGPVSESFSNSVVESELSNQINTASSNAREARFSLGNGNIIGGALQDAVTSVASAVGNLAAGALDGITAGYGSGIMSALGLLAGNGFIDIPKHWQSSTASLPKSTYNIELVSPYGNVISQMTNIYIPLSMLLVAALPLATGKQSYTSPFLVQMFDRGRCQVQTGMVESLTVTRGTSNLGFTNLGSPLAMKVSFSIIDLSSVISMPVSGGGLFNLGNISQDNILNDYIAVLAGQDIYSQIYALPKLKMNIAKSINSAKRFVSPAYWASFSHNAVTGGFLSFFPVSTIANGYEGLSRGGTLLNPVNAGY